MVHRMSVLICVLFIIAESQWVRRYNNIPQARQGMVVGAYNQTISLLGGYKPLNRELITYNISDNTFAIANLSELLPNQTITYGASQYYTAVNEIIYMADSDYLSIYNMQTNTYIQQWQSLPVAGYSQT